MENEKQFGRQVILSDDVIFTGEKGTPEEEADFDIFKICLDRIHSIIKEIDVPK